MNSLYLALINLGISLLIRKVQADTATAAERQALVDAVEAQWKRVEKAHAEVQDAPD